MWWFLNLLPRRARRNRREDMDVTAWIAMGIVALLFVGPLVWRTWRDHLEDRALSLQADLQAAVNHALGGESLVAVRVKAGAHDKTGTVEIYVPQAGRTCWRTCGRWCCRTCRLVTCWSSGRAPRRRLLRSDAPPDLRFIPAVLPKLVAIAGIVMILAIVWDAFEALVLPRTANRPFRP